MPYSFKTYKLAPKLAYKALRLINPAAKNRASDMVMELGTFRIIESQAAVAAVVDAFILELAEVSSLIATEYEAVIDKTDWEKRSNLYDKHNEILHQFKSRCVLSYGDFIRFVGHEEAEAKKALPDRAGAKQVRALARYRFADIQGGRGFTRDFRGYQAYLKAANKKLHEIMSKDLPAILPEKPRRFHSYILSTTHTGKTELLKAICLNYLRQPDHAGVVVLDAGGDMARQMARWMELVPSGKLVYIDPFLSKFNSPIINPFDAEKLNEQDRGLLTDQIVLALGSLVQGKTGGEISVNMEAVLYHCVRLLIDLPNTNIRDLRKLLKDDADLIEAGCNSHDQDIANYFQTEFTKLPNISATKAAILAKIGKILGKGVLGKILCGRTSIDLERLMAKRKFIVVNLSKGRLGVSESSAFGTLLVSLIQAIAMKRERLKQSERPMTHLIIDECQNFVTTSIKDIIRETRKFGLSVTLAQQELGGEMPPDIKNVVTKTTNVKVAGRSEKSETKLTGELVGVEGQDIYKLEAGQFYWKNGTAPPFLLHVRSDFIDYKGGMSNDLWLKVAKQQQQFYYRRLDDTFQTKPPASPANKSTSPIQTRKLDFE